MIDPEYSEAAGLFVICVLLLEKRPDYQYLLWVGSRISQGQL